MAGDAALSSDRSMLERERSAHVGVALGADLVLVFRRSQVVCRKVPCTSWQSVHFTRPSFTLWWNGHVELRLLIGMALIAERGLRSLEQSLLLAAVNAVATGATDAGLGVRRALEVGMRPRVAAQALASTSLIEALAGSKILVTSPPPATCSLPAPWQFSQVTPLLLPCISAIFGVRIVGEPLGHLLVACGAGVGAHKFGVPRGRPPVQAHRLGSLRRGSQRRCG